MVRGSRCQPSSTTWCVFMCVRETDCVWMHAYVLLHVLWPSVCVCVCLFVFCKLNNVIIGVDTIIGLPPKIFTANILLPKMFFV